MSGQRADVDPDTRNILLWIQYDGAGFAGWQRQAVDRTVQGEVEDALASMTQHPVTLRSTSRTDAGVHARAMPAHFTTARDIPVQGFVRGLNSLLPGDVAVIDGEERPLDWNARAASVAKTYCYRYLVSPTRKPLLASNSWYIGDRPLDVQAMSAAGALMLGLHDFSAFRAAGCDATNPQRHLHEVSLEVDPDTNVHCLRVVGNAFLRNMVRLIAGTLYEVGLGKRDPEEIGRLLAQAEPQLIKLTAPACGLTLEEVHFHGYPRLGK